MANPQNIVKISNDSFKIIGDVPIKNSTAVGNDVLAVDTSAVIEALLEVAQEIRKLRLGLTLTGISMEVE